MIEVVKPSGGLFPNALEEGISLDVYSTFIEPPPTLDSGVKVCFLLSLNSPYLSVIFTKGRSKESKCSSIFFPPDFSYLNINISFRVASQMGQLRMV